MGSGGKKGGGKKGPGLEPEDFRLWKAFTRDIEPLEEPDWDSMEAEFREQIVPVDAVRQKKEAVTAPGKPSATAQTKSAQPPQLDLRTELRLRRGQMPIEGRLDLHGRNQEQAHTMLNDFIASSHGRGKRCVLVITGKGRGGLAAQDAYAPDLQPGILKQKLPQWLSMHPLRDMVLKIMPAMPKDGGGGAFYIYLRRQRGEDFTAG